MSCFFLTFLLAYDGFTVSYYVDLLELLHETTYQTELGQMRTCISLHLCSYCASHNHPLLCSGHGPGYRQGPFDAVLPAFFAIRHTLRIG